MSGTQILDHMHCATLHNVSMSAYTKLFGSILDSTVWQAPDNVRLVWITMLAMKDQDGIVEASVPGLASRAKQSRIATEQALAVLSAPDPDSRTIDYNGRRIEVVDGGWRVLNHHKYREKSGIDEMREKAAARQIRYRERQRARNVTVTPHDARNVIITAVTTSDQIRSYSDTDTDHTKKETSPQAAPGLAVAPGKPKAKQGKADATADEMAIRDRVLTRLGERNNCRYTGGKAHTRLIVGRLRDGFSEDDLRRVVAYCAEGLGWQDPAHNCHPHLKPETLFGPESIERYVYKAREYRKNESISPTEASAHA